jgi:putative flippase GtrA
VPFVQSFVPFVYPSFCPVFANSSSVLHLRPGRDAAGRAVRYKKAPRAWDPFAMPRLPPPAPDLLIRARALALRFRQQGKFAVVGVINTLVHVAVFSLLYHGLGTIWPVANTAGYCTGVLNSFVLNKYWTFAESRGEGRISRQLPLFLVLNLVALGLSNLTIWALEPILPVEAGLLAAILVTFAWNFWSSRRFVYRAAASPRA